MHTCISHTLIHVPKFIYIYIYGTSKCKVMDASPKNEITGCTGTAMSWMFKRYSCLTVF